MLYAAALSVSLLLPLHHSLAMNVFIPHMPPKVKFAGLVQDLLRNFRTPFPSFYESRKHS